MLTCPIQWSTSYDSARAGSCVSAGGAKSWSENPGQTVVSGAGGRPPSELWGRRWLYSRRHCSIRICTSLSVKKSSPFRSSSRSLPLNDSMEPFSQGLLGSMNRVATNSAPLSSIYV